METVHVRQVVGRYPHGPAVLRSENVEATVTATDVAGVYRIRLDDAQHADAWTELVIEVRT